MEQLKLSLAQQREEYLLQFPHQDQTSSDDTKQSTSVEDTTRALDFECKWGKYKGTTYREIYIRDPNYFQRIVLKNLSKLPETFIWRALSPLKEVKKKLSVAPASEDETEFPSPPKLVRQ